MRVLGWIVIALYGTAIVLLAQVSLVPVDPSALVTAQHQQQQDSALQALQEMDKLIAARVDRLERLGDGILMGLLAVGLGQIYAGRKAYQSQSMLTDLHKLAHGKKRVVRP